MRTIVIATALAGLSNAALASAPPAAPCMPTAGTVLGGGNDDCATPDTISGTGTFYFDNTSATTGTEGQNEANCVAFSTSAIALDVWFSWTADATGAAKLSTVGLTSLDTKVAVYPGGGCPLDGTSIVCNDDEPNGSFQSEVSWNVTNGTTYTIQLGSFPGTTPVGGTGDFNIEIEFPDCNDNGVDDAIDISNGTSDDENWDQIPDECQELPCFEVKKFLMNPWVNAIIVQGSLTPIGDFNPAHESFDIRICDGNDSTYKSFNVPKYGMVPYWSHGRFWFEYQSPLYGGPSYRLRYFPYTCEWWFDVSSSVYLFDMQGPDFEVKMRTSRSGYGADDFSTYSILSGWKIFRDPYYTSCCLTNPF